MDSPRFDVAIVGGGLAGTCWRDNCGASFLKSRWACSSGRLESSFKVGESTVEIASNYLIRRLGLSTYLYARHLPKNGLRFFFDTPERDAPLERMSEIGTAALPYYPSFQINRLRLENDLRARNADDGVLAPVLLLGYQPRSYKSSTRRSRSAALPGMEPVLPELTGSTAPPVEARTTSPAQQLRQLDKLFDEG